MTKSPRPPLAMYLPDFAMGGVAAVVLRLARGLGAHGLPPLLIVDRDQGELRGEVPAGCPVLSLEAGRKLEALPRLARLLRRQRPQVLISHLGHGNIMATLAALGTGTKVVACQHNALSAQTAASDSLSHRLLPGLYRWTQHWTAGYVAVSEGVACDWAATACIPRRRICTIYNPVVDETFAARAAEPVEDPAFGSWYSPANRDHRVPVLVCVGRLEDQKDIPTLLHAFALLRRQRAARLVLVGDGSRRGDLERLAADLGIAGDVWFAGTRANPLPFIRQADLLVLSSRFEGFGLVLVEALACGTPVVSTNCPHGPAEILEGGLLGALVPVGEAPALAKALEGTLEQPPDRAALQQRAAAFTAEEATGAYLRLLLPLLAPRTRTGEPRSAGATLLPER
ncbi:glycosyltransferase [Oleisolibacter albus]|uniref:glycosyltransferase n=1 Tax=Oleisolibacter albus TaxID=2171757 RepID=UPI00138FD01C|nr:glycosyltransferase [Oleisolibacter albus]